MLSKVGEHTPLLIVQRTTTFPEPAVTPVTVVVGELGLVIVALPLTRVQVPVVPATDALPAIVKVLLLHWIISGPALATFGAASTFIVIPALGTLTHPAAEVITTLTTSLSARVVVV